MHRWRRPVLLVLVLAGLAGIGMASLPESEAGWAKCVEGTYKWDENHCYLGIPSDCSECWVI